MPFRVTRERTSHFEVEGDSGPFRIAKVGLAPATHARLRAMCRGGEAKGYDAGGPVDQGDAPAQTDAQLALQAAGQPDPVPQARDVGAQLGRNLAERFAPDAGSLAAQVYAHAIGQLTGEDPAAVLQRYAVAHPGERWAPSGLAQVLGSTVPVTPAAGAVHAAGSRLARLMEHAPDVARALHAAITGAAPEGEGLARFLGREALSEAGRAAVDVAGADSPGGRR